MGRGKKIKIERDRHIDTEKDSKVERVRVKWGRKRMGRSKD